LVRDMSHGGARENAGNKHKWVDKDGNPLETRTVRVPKALPRSELERLIREALEKGES